MRTPPLPPFETERLKALRRYKILDTLDEQAFNDLTAIAAHICGTPIALVSLVDGHRQWFKSKIGLAATETPRELAFCAYAILQQQPLIVPDTLEDQRFATNPLVTSDPKIRFYAGAPLVTPDGHALGTICALDLIPRQLEPKQIEALQALSRQVMAQLELRLNWLNVLQINEQLWQSEERFRLLVESVKDYAIFLLDVDGYVTSWNTGAERTKGYKSEEIIGKHFSCLYTEADVKQGKPERGLQVATALGRFEDDTWCVRQDGSQFWANIIITALHDKAGLLRGFAEVTRDITAHKQVEEALKADLASMNKLNHLKDDFLSTASHELRTPITNMKMALHMLKGTPDVKRRERYLEILETECMREAQLINDLLDLQRMESASYSTSLELVNLQDWLPSIVEPFYSRTTERLQTLQVNFAPELPPLVSDSASLERILAELLNNACKYTPTGGDIKFNVRYDYDKPGLSSTPVTIFTICNSVEIAATALPRIFEKFYRIPHADPWRQGGTGLGLALVQKLVAQLQGTIQVESSRGWTTFTVQLPNQ